MNRGDKTHTVMSLIVLALVIGLGVALMGMGVGINGMRLFEWLVTK